MEERGYQIGNKELSFRKHMFNECFGVLFKNIKICCREQEKKIIKEDKWNSVLIISKEVVFEAF